MQRYHSDEFVGFVKIWQTYLIPMKKKQIYLFLLQSAYYLAVQTTYITNRTSVLLVMELYQNTRSSVKKDV